MHLYSKSTLFFVFILSLLLAIGNGGSINEERQLYIVYMGELPADTTTLADDHYQLLSDSIGHEETARQSKVYSYGRSFNGFAATLLPHEAESLLQKEKVISVFPSKQRKLHTTRSWDFLGVPLKVERNVQAESNIIVGLLDTGIYVESKSFDDTGFGPPPSKWKGECQNGRSNDFPGCNNKVIGARYFNVEGKAFPEGESPADHVGHGTHTSSTAGGVPVVGANLYGLAKGIARGGVPSARIAMYKTCWTGSCSDADLLAGFDAAIADGVDILSVSIGGPAFSYFDDPISIGSFHAAKKGIFVACSAGNSGTFFSSLENVAPWIFTVGASSIDRGYDTPVKLGDGQVFHGSSFNFNQMRKMYPLVSGTRAKDPNATGELLNARLCDDGSLLKDKVEGKIVFCRISNQQEIYIKELGGAGTIETDYDENLDSPWLKFPAESTVSNHDGDQIEKYINTTENPTAIILKSMDVWNRNSPSIASFSSRGPEMISRKILKPDIVAPGNSILAAFSRLITLKRESYDGDDNRVVDYILMSGTSMACPHVASAAAYIKSFHPDWSAAAIRSALMTTAKPMRFEPKGAELASGAGNINPVKALDPGLVYDMDENSYLSFLCQQGYNDTLISLLAGNNTRHCSEFPTQTGHDGLNYPSMHYQLNSSNDTDIAAVFQRTVTYVGEGGSQYKVIVKSPEGLSIKVEPETLDFTEKGQKGSFTVTLQGKFLNETTWYLSGAIVWNDLKHFVKSPILIYRPQNY